MALKYIPKIFHHCFSRRWLKAQKAFKRHREKKNNKDWFNVSFPFFPYLPSPFNIMLKKKVIKCLFMASLVVFMITTGTDSNL